MTSYAISYAFSCLPGPAQKRSRSGSDAPRFESNAAVAHPVRLSVFVGLEIGLQWFTNPYKASRPPVLPPPSLPGLPGGLFGGLLSGRSTTVVLRRGSIPLHKLTLEKRGEFRVGHKIQGRRVPHEHVGNVGDQVLGNLWHRWECRTNRSQRRRNRVLHGIGQVHHVSTHTHTVHTHD